MKLHRILKHRAARDPRAAAASSPSACTRWWYKKSPTWVGAAALLATGCGSGSSVTGWPTEPMGDAAVLGPPPQASTGGDGTYGGSSGGGSGGDWMSGAGSGAGSGSGGGGSGGSGAGSSGGSGAGTGTPGGDANDAGWIAPDSGTAADDASTGGGPWADAGGGGGPTVPDSGGTTTPPPGGSGPPDAGTAPASTTFTTVYTTVLGACAGCHVSPGAAGNLDMGSQTNAYKNLVGVPASGAACGASGETRVVPGNSATSLLYQKAAGVETCGGTMSPSSSAGVMLIQQWIDDGAKND
jgi:hypothetical protein